MGLKVPTLYGDVNADLVFDDSLPQHLNFISQMVKEQLIGGKMEGCHVTPEKNCMRGVLIVGRRTYTVVHHSEYQRLPCDSNHTVVSTFMHEVSVGACLFRDYAQDVFFLTRDALN